MSQRVAVLALAAALLAAAPAHAAPRTQAAADFAEAALHAQVAANAQRADHRRRQRAVRISLCLRTIFAAGERNKRRAEKALNVFYLAFMRPVADTFLPVGRRLVADLDAVPTRDPALIAGRDAWRGVVAAFERLPSLDRPCERLDEWRRSGWDPAKAPPDLPDVVEALEDGDDVTSGGLQAAARRLRRLGVSRGAARRFLGERLFADLVGDLHGGAAEPAAARRP